MTVEIRPIALPARDAAPDASWAELEAYAALVRRLDVETLGTADLARRPAELLVSLTDREDRAHIALGAFDAGALVGLAEVVWELDTDATTAFVSMLGVEPERRREGIGSRLLAEAERVAAAAEHPTTVLSADHLLAHDDGGGERLHAPQGGASLPAGLGVVRFALAHGYALGQLDRVSALDLDGRADGFRRRLAELEASASPSAAGYRIETWIDRAPDDLVDSLAVAHERMSVDAPSGAIAYEFEPWDAARVRHDEQRSLASGRTSLVAAAVAPDGEVAGFTQLSLLPESRAVEQWDTIVLAVHRGHRLGLRLKLANLVLLAGTDPARDRVYTWNADENAHMLAINDALGFTPFALESQWQRP
ncbi:GNAT family N-acetyltransferase [Agromyces larvae]|uniref:GNAT family N-acetyltransferase n=1 Tax=Agromyces larvae TaxID=2929802 RepID=A0ABY4C238_9MICO|nr:GNAT family N-acetyltransferase [Agromyces larvae]UOE45394.1 GNAT family N-acetyltransferase [Agromyces larvae]